MDSVEIGLQCIGALSMVSCFSVLLTMLIFRDLLDTMFMRLIFIVSFCDLLASLGDTFGFPESNELLCPVQAVMIQFFYRASFMWMTFFSIQLYWSVKYNRYLFTDVQLHVICWGLGILFQILPRAFGMNYGQDDDLSGHVICVFRGHPSRLGFFMFWACYRFFISILILTNTILFILIMMAVNHRRFTDDRNLNSSVGASTNEIKAISNLKISLRRFALYPIISALSWLPYIGCSFQANLNQFHLLKTPSISNDEFDFVFCAAALLGFVNSFLFYYNSKRVRNRWNTLLSRYTLYNQCSSIFLSCFCCINNQRKDHPSSSRSTLKISQSTTNNPLTEDVSNFEIEFSTYDNHQLQFSTSTTTTTTTTTQTIPSSSNNDDEEKKEDIERGSSHHHQHQVNKNHSPPRRNNRNNNQREESHERDNNNNNNNEDQGKNENGVEEEEEEEEEFDQYSERMSIGRR